jgi:hypothetical protein
MCPNSHSIQHTLREGVEVLQWGYTALAVTCAVAACSCPRTSSKLAHSQEALVLAVSPATPAMASEEVVDDGPAVT